METSRPTSPSILVLNGPNLNMLGTRQPEIYGATTLVELETLCIEYGRGLGWDVVCVQSNHEGVMIDTLQDARGTYLGVILNAGGYTHTSVAIRDAIAAIEIPVVEVHISDIHAREPFRHHSYIQDVAIAQICGKGISGYTQALDLLNAHLDRGVSP